MKMIPLSREYIQRHPIAAYAVVWLLSLFIVGLELVGSGASGSQALLADVGHVASDTLLALVPLTALLLARTGVSRERVVFWSSIAAVALLCYVGVHVGGESLAALMGEEHHDHEVDGWLLLAFSGVAAIANLLQHRLLSRVSSEHHHGAHKGLHFHVLMDLVKNLVLPLLGVLIALAVVPESADLWAALLIGGLLIVRALFLLYATLRPKRPDACHVH